MNRCRHTLISAGIVAVAVGVVLGVLAMMPPRPGLTKANIERIKKGMTRAEVVAILGQPLSDVEFPYPCYRLFDWRRDDGKEAWAFFKNGDVVSYHLDESTETIPDKLRRWLHLPK